MERKLELRAREILQLDVEVASHSSPLKRGRKALLDQMITRRQKPLRCHRYWHTGKNRSQHSPAFPSDTSHHHSVLSSLTPSFDPHNRNHIGRDQHGSGVFSHGLKAKEPASTNGYADTFLISSSVRATEELSG